MKKKVLEMCRLICIRISIMKTIILLLLILCAVESFKLKNVAKKVYKAVKEVAKETWVGLKNGPTHTNGNWAGEKIVRAEYATRPLQGAILEHVPFDHHGIVLHTSDGNKWLLHNTPDSGVVVTDAKHMSNKWNIVTDIHVNGDKTIAQTLRSAGSSSFHSERCGYWKGGWCYGTAKSVEKYLQK